jgi:protein SCO1
MNSRSISKHGFGVLIFALAFSSAALGQIVTEPSAERLPPQLGDVGIEQRLNNQLPLSLTFRDESGHPVTLGQYFVAGRPVIVSLVYFNCRMLCDQVLTSMASAMHLLKFDAGRQFEVLTISFDPHDTPEVASAAKKRYLAMYGHPGTDDGWHFLTGNPGNIRQVADAVGFHYRWDERTQQFAHAAGITLLTPQGRIAQYYYGARYFPSDLRLGLIEASQNHIGTLADQIVLYCYHWDPRTGRYGVIVSRVIQVSGGLTLLILGGLVLFLFRAYPTRSAHGDREPQKAASGRSVG